MIKVTIGSNFNQKAVLIATRHEARSHYNTTNHKFNIEVSNVRGYSFEFEIRRVFCASVYIPVSGTKVHR